MFDHLTERLTKTFRRWIQGRSMSKSELQAGFAEIRRALLEADVALSVVDEFLQTLETQALNHVLETQLTPAQEIVKLVNQALTRLLGEKNAALHLRVPKPAVLLLAGLQGSGKTTTAAKLALRLKKTENKKILLASTDVYRPAAIQQLAVLAEQVGVTFFKTTATAPLEIAQEALEAAKKQGQDILIVDTAGRLHVDATLMEEIKVLHQALRPAETLFIVDAMMGQDAAIAAKAFHDTLPLTGVILTKADGDARGGAALSIRQITGQPIKFLGLGEKVDALEAFYPDRFASRILGMGDILSLIEEIEHRVDKQKAEKLSQKLQQGRGFDLNDLKEQLQTMNAMGGMQALVAKLPQIGGIAPGTMKNMLEQRGANQFFQKMVCIIDSMTPEERAKPLIINGSRKRRIARGAGVQIQDVARVLKQCEDMQKMMKKFMGGGMQKLMGLARGLKGGLQGSIPPDILRRN